MNSNMSITIPSKDSASPISAGFNDIPVDGAEIVKPVKKGRDTSSSSRWCQVGSSFSGPIAGTVTQIEHLDHQVSLYNSFFSNVIGSLFGLLAIIIGKVISPLLYPIYKLICRTLGIAVDESLKIPNDNIWHRSFRTAGVFVMNLFMVPGAIIGYLYVSGHIHLNTASHFSISAGTLLTGTIAGIAIGIIAGVSQYFHDKRRLKKQQGNPNANPNKDQFGIDAWSKRLKAGVTVGNQAGLLVGCIIAACTLPPAIEKLPLLNSFINMACSSVGGAIGGILALAIGPVLNILHTRLCEYPWYQKLLAVMANGNSTNNPPSNRIKAGLQIGGSLGAILGFCLGMLFPGVGHVIFMGLGTAIGSLVGGTIGYVAEPILGYFKNNHVKELYTANPWSNRIRSGAIMGTCLGLLLSCIASCFFPAVAPLMIPLGSLAGAIIFSASEPLYVSILTEIYGERIRDQEDLLQDQTGNPWTARLPIGCMLGGAIGGVIGLVAGGPAGLLIGASVGGMAGGLAGLCFINSIRELLRDRLSRLGFNRLVNSINILCDNSKAPLAPEPKPDTPPSLATSSPFTLKKAGGSTSLTASPQPGEVTAKTSFPSPTLPKPTSSTAHSTQQLAPKLGIFKQQQQFKLPFRDWLPNKQQSDDASALSSQRLAI